MNETLEKLKKIMAEKFGVAKEDITSTSDLASDLNLSNLEISDLITEVVREFEVVLPQDEEIEKIRTVTDLINLIDAYSREL